ncbi:MAG: hypothetical protein ABIP48_09880 [Planctomycetota bacterium]
MTVKLLHLTTCPYCAAGAGEIGLALDRITSLHQCYEDDVLRADLAPDLNPFVLSSDQRGSGPCKHLVFLSGTFFYLEFGKEDARGGRTWDLTCDWWHPTVDELDDELESFVVHLTNEVVLLPGGDVPLGIEWFSKEWPDQERMGWPSRRYRVDGNVVFCRDAATFFEDLAMNNDAYTAWWNGEDPLGPRLFVAGYTAGQLCDMSPMNNPC